MLMHLLDVVEVISSQPSGADGSIVAFDIGVLLRFSSLDVDQPDASVFSPIL